MYWFCTAICVNALAQPIPPNSPTRIRNLLQGGGENTSEIEWRLSWHDDVNEGLVERFTTRRAGRDAWESNYGDSRGHHAVEYSRPTTGLSDEEIRQIQIPKENSAGTRSSMTYDGQLWHLPRAETPLSGLVESLETAKAYHPNNPLIIGATVGVINELDATPFRIPFSFAEGFESAEFQESVDSDSSAVTATWGGGMFRLNWEFDQRVGDQPVRTLLERDGELAYYSETDYEKKDNRWVPTEARFFRGSSTTPYKRIEIDKISFDQPDHLQEFDPSDMGALYGTQFTTATGLKMWTGDGLVRNTEFWDLVYLYNADPHPKIIQLIANEIGLSVEEYKDFLRRGAENRRAEYRRTNKDEPWLVVAKAKKDNEDEWDVYLKKFLLKHSLSDSAVDRAKEITKKAKQIRDAYREKNKSDMREAKREGNKKKLAELEASENRIFKRLLEKPLNRLIRDNDQKAEAHSK